MKKFLFLLTALTLSVFFSACTTKNTTQSEQSKQAKAQYKDGTYKAEGDKWQFGQEDATVEIKDDKITSITLRRLDTNGKEVDYDQWQGQKDETGKVHPNLKQFRLDMAKKMIDKQSTDVDTISGATVSTKNWKAATQRALDEAKK
ncbi:FMN-binding protein [Clostridium sp. MSJ-4]|uniref:FMN-binding protein n=1 Tax=Clostridium simiarum TaxID=2841506 RepID=A0ABS6F2U5_9CLOT|nr:FMN-binding protein [Clostridium simiarum]MBU5592220.1 FMN-binding protein [Clostridium simiarum]